MSCLPIIDAHISGIAHFPACYLNSVTLSAVTAVANSPLSNENSLTGKHSGVSLEFQTFTDSLRYLRRKLTPHALYKSVRAPSVTCYRRAGLNTTEGPGRHRRHALVVIRPAPAAAGSNQSGPESRMLYRGTVKL